MRPLILFLQFHSMYKPCRDHARYWLSGFRLGFGLICSGSDLNSDWFIRVPIMILIDLSRFQLGFRLMDQGINTCFMKQKSRGRDWTGVWIVMPLRNWSCLAFQMVQQYDRLYRSYSFHVKRSFHVMCWIGFCLLGAVMHSCAPLWARATAVKVNLKYVICGCIKLWSFILGELMLVLISWRKQN